MSICQAPVPHALLILDAEVYPLPPAAHVNPTKHNVSQRTLCPLHPCPPCMCTTASYSPPPLIICSFAATWVLQQGTVSQNVGRPSQPLLCVAMHRHKLLTPPHLNEAAQACGLVPSALFHHVKQHDGVGAHGHTLLYPIAAPDQGLGACGLAVWQL